MHCSVLTLKRYFPDFEKDGVSFCSCSALLSNLIKIYNANIQALLSYKSRIENNTFSKKALNNLRIDAN